MALKKEIAWLLEHYEQNSVELLKEFFTFLSFKSVSAESEYQPELLKCCSWVEDFLNEAGFKVERWETNGHPTIFAEWSGAENGPTVLIYNHYDVQPIDPIELWDSPPFEATIKDGEVYARGAQDNKGQCFYVISSLRALLKRDGKLPVNVKLIIEGEEEIGSSGLSVILTERAAQLRADHLFVVDMGWRALAAPAVTLGVRGIATMTMEVNESISDLHSGIFGGLVLNPNRVLANLISSCFDDDGRVAVKGFYDGVKEYSKAELAEIDFRLDDAEFKVLTGLETPTKITGVNNPLEQTWIMPTLEFNGIWGGYCGQGFKTVIPKSAYAKISCRIVGSQDPEVVANLVIKHLKEHAPKSVNLKFEIHPGLGAAVNCSPLSSSAQIAKQVYQELTGKQATFIMSGGSIPITAELAKAAGAIPLFLGLGLPGDNLHAPNEHFGLERIKLGFASIGGLLIALAESQNQFSG